MKLSWEWVQVPDTALEKKDEKKSVRQLSEG